MLNLLFRIFFDECGDTLTITRPTANTLITAAGFGTRYDQIEAVVNGGINSDDNIEADGVKAVALNADVVRADKGLSQHTDGTLQVDPSDTNPGLELTDGGLRAKVAELINRVSDCLTWGRSGDMLLSSNTNTPTNFTDVSTTYSDKFIRINATALSEAGADTHTHGAGSYAVGSHTHNVRANEAIWGAGSGAAGELLTDTFESDKAQNAPATTSTTPSFSGTSAAGDNVPAYVTLRMYKKD